jgi:predicted nucleic-acid-binding Zn-ribbon protein
VDVTNIQFGDATCLDCGLFWAEAVCKDEDNVAIECLRCGSHDCKFDPIEGTEEELFGPFND